MHEPDLLKLLRPDGVNEEEEDADAGDDDDKPKPDDAKPKPKPASKKTPKRPTEDAGGILAKLRKLNDEHEDEAP